jgi:FlaA1/EpsC-like NDP-sugar epimerase
MKVSILSDSAVRRTALLMALYAVGLVLSLLLAYELRFDFAMEQTYLPGFWFGLAWIVPLKLVAMIVFGQFSGLPSYFSVPDLRRLFYATASSSSVVVLVWFQSAGAYAPPRGVILTDFMISFLGLAAARLGFRLVRERYLTPEGRPNRQAKRVGIIGAGDVGASLARELSAKRGLGLAPVAFFDDNRAKWRSRVHEVPVVGAPETLLDHRLNLQLEQVIIAMPGAPAKRVGEVIRILQQTRLPFATVPSPEQLATGQVKVSQLRSVEIQDLLNRQPVKLHTDDIRQVLQNRVVMVTGAGGSIGGELARQIGMFNPKRLLLVEQSEVQMFQIEQELMGLGLGGVILSLVGDVLDDGRMRQIHERFRPQVIFHAAAHKHVPMMENQPAEAIKNNVLGTAQAAKLALEYGADRFVMISTDKAINPASVMGATKRLAEIFVQAIHASQPDIRTKFMAVRFGNVLGSSGSVIPTFQKQIAAGGPVKVTHAEVTRYFMTTAEAVGLVLQSGAQGTGGEIFVLDMGEPVKIVDLARQLIELNGLKPEEDIEIEFVGLRPGEKLLEELSYKGENVLPTNHPKIMRFVSRPISLAEAQEKLRVLTADMYALDPNQLKLRLKQAVPEYQPYLT